MPARFSDLFFIICASALLFSPLGHADQPATTNAPLYNLVPENTNPLAPPTLSSPSVAPTPSTSSTLTTPKDAASKMIEAAVERMNAKDINGALNDLSQALKLNPNSTGAYVLRASIYYQQKNWAQSEADFTAAAKLAPTNVVLKFNLAQVKFAQKQYDAARAAFVALQKDMAKDPDMRDFTAYQIFLCNLIGGHEDAAKKELDVFNDAMGNPSYYFGNAAWDLVHKNLDDARSWLLSASRIYPPRKNEFYAQGLRDLGYLPIPGPDDKVIPPASETNNSPLVPAPVLTPAQPAAPETNSPALTPTLPPTTNSPTHL